MNCFDIIEDNPEALEATNKAALPQHIKDNNLEVNIEVAMKLGKSMNMTLQWEKNKNFSP